MSTSTVTPLHDVDARVARLRAEPDPSAARDLGWSWICELGQRARSDRDGALAELDALFGSGRPSEAVDGQTEGILVTFATTPVIDQAIAGITGVWMPWMGKSFDASTQRGDNTLAESATLPAKLLWPLYQVRRGQPRRVRAFDFTTRVESGALDPDVDVLVIDYSTVADNPRLIIKSIRDELVEIAPGAHLGKMLWHHRDDHHTLLAYFALKSDPAA